MTPPAMAVATLAAVLGGWLSTRAYRPTTPEACPRRVTLFACGAGACGAMAWRFDLSPALPAYWWLATLATPLSMWDLTERRLPNHLVLPAYPIVTATLSAAALAGFGPPDALVHSAASTAAAVLLLGALYGIGLGAGDAKLGVLLASAAGWLSYTRAFVTFAACFVIAALTVLALRCTRRAASPDRLPLGPFLLAGFLLAVLIP